MEADLSKVPKRLVVMNWSNPGGSPKVCFPGVRAVLPFPDLSGAPSIEKGVAKMKEDGAFLVQYQKEDVSFPVSLIVLIKEAKKVEKDGRKITLIIGEFTRRVLLSSHCDEEFGSSYEWTPAEETCFSEEEFGSQETQEMIQGVARLSEELLDLMQQGSPSILPEIWKLCEKRESIGEFLDNISSPLLSVCSMSKEVADAAEALICELGHKKRLEILSFIYPIAIDLLKKEKDSSETFDGLVAIPFDVNDGTELIMFPGTPFMTSLGVKGSLSEERLLKKIREDKEMVFYTPKDGMIPQIGILVHVRTSRNNGLRSISCRALRRVEILDYQIDQGMFGVKHGDVDEIQLGEKEFLSAEVQKKISDLKAFSERFLSFFRADESGGDVEIDERHIKNSESVESLGKYLDVLAQQLVFIFPPIDSIITSSLRELICELDQKKRIEILLNAYPLAIEFAKKTVSGESLIIAPSPDLLANPSQHAERRTAFKLEDFANDSAEVEVPLSDKPGQRHRSPEVETFYRFLRKNVIGEGGQKRAIKRLTTRFEVYRSLFRKHRKPIGTFLFLGPSGVGKTELAERVAEFLLGQKTSVTKIACGEYTEGHQVSRLIGSPPGYVGSDDRPLLAQERVDRYGIEAEIKWLQSQLNEPNLPPEKEKVLLERLKIFGSHLGHKQGSRSGESSKAIRTADLARAYPVLSVLLVDEIDKAHENLLKFFLEVSSKGVAQLSNGEEVDLSNSFIIFTSNHGSKKIAQILHGKVTRVGFGDGHQEKSVYEVAMDELRRVLPPELIGRIQDDIVVFSELSHEEMRKIRDLRFSELDLQIRAKMPNLSVEFDGAAKEFIFSKSSDHPEYGARVLEAKIDHYVIEPLAEQLNNGELKDGDKVLGVLLAGDEEMEIRFKKV